MEEECSSLAKKVSAAMEVREQDLKTIAFHRDSLIEMEKAQQEDEDEEEKGEDRDKDEDGEE